MNKNIVIIGMPGSGKTTIGFLVAKKLNMKFIDMDNEIERIEKKSISEMFSINEDYFRDAETRYTIELGKLNSFVISTGGGIIKRKENIDYMKVNSIIVFLNREPENIIGDIDVKSRPLIKDKINSIYKLYNERIPLYKNYCDIEILNDTTIEVVVDRIINAVSKLI